MPKASDLKRGLVVDFDGVPHVVKQVEAKSPSSRGASTLYKIRFTNLKSGQKLDQSFKGDDFVQVSDCVRVKVQFSYVDGDHYHFMNMEDFSQYSIDSDAIVEQKGFLVDGLSDITALLVDGVLCAIELPVSVVLEIVDTPPGIKGASATGRTKTARLSSGLEIQVPEYLECGVLVRVNTDSGKFMSRV